MCYSFHDSVGLLRYGQIEFDSWTSSIHLSTISTCLLTQYPSQQYPTIRHHHSRSLDFLCLPALITSITRQIQVLNQVGITPARNLVSSTIHRHPPRHCIIRLLIPTMVSSSHTHINARLQGPHQHSIKQVVPEHRRIIRIPDISHRHRPRRTPFQAEVDLDIPTLQANIVPRTLALVRTSSVFWTIRVGEGALSGPYMISHGVRLRTDTDTGTVKDKGMGTDKDKDMDKARTCSQLILAHG